MLSSDVDLLYYNVVRLKNETTAQFDCAKEYIVTIKKQIIWQQDAT